MTSLRPSDIAYDRRGARAFGPVSVQNVHRCRPQWRATVPQTPAAARRGASQGVRPVLRRRRPETDRGGRRQVAEIGQRTRSRRPRPLPDLAIFASSGRSRHGELAGQVRRGEFCASPTGAGHAEFLVGNLLDPAAIGSDRGGSSLGDVSGACLAPMGVRGAAPWL